MSSSNPPAESAASSSSGLPPPPPTSVSPPAEGMASSSSLPPPPPASVSPPAESTASSSSSLPPPPPASVSPPAETAASSSPSLLPPPPSVNPPAESAASSSSGLPPPPPTSVSPPAESAASSSSSQPLPPPSEMQWFLLTFGECATGPFIEKFVIGAVDMGLRLRKAPSVNVSSKTPEDARQKMVDAMSHFPPDTALLVVMLDCMGNEQLKSMKDDLNIRDNDPVMLYVLPGGKLNDASYMKTRMRSIRNYMKNNSWFLPFCGNEETASKLKQGSFYCSDCQKYLMRPIDLVNHEEEKHQGLMSDSIVGLFAQGSCWGKNRSAVQDCLMTGDLAPWLLNAQIEKMLNDIPKMANAAVAHRYATSSSFVPGDPELNRKQAEHWAQMVDLVSYQEMLPVRQKLPAFYNLEAFLTAVEKFPVLIVVGETGSGKSTQTPQVLAGQLVMAGKGAQTAIYVGEPRQLVVESLWSRLNAELGDPMKHLGEIVVGFQHRMDQCKPRQRGSICVVTFGILVQMLKHDPYLSGISHLFLDEVHEKNSDADLVMMKVKELLKGRRKDLKLILMSATVNTETYINYFGGRKVVGVVNMGKQSNYTVTEHYLDFIAEKIPAMDYGVKDEEIEKERLGQIQQLVSSKANVQRLCKMERKGCTGEQLVAFVKYLHRTTNADEAILIFVRGWSDIESILHEFEQDNVLCNQLLVPLHGELTKTEQQKVFAKPAPGQRKIIISSPIAETSITIDDAVHVIDLGNMNIAGYDWRQNVHTLTPSSYTKVNRGQRKGRVGRVRDGHIYYWSMSDTPIDDEPEAAMQQTNLMTTVLQLKCMGSEPYDLLDAPNPPATERISNAVEQLKELGALDSTGELTLLGQHLADLPVDPRCGRMLLYGIIFGCIDSVITAVCALEHKAPFGRSFEMDSNDMRWRRLTELAGTLNSDHLLNVKVARKWKQLSGAPLMNMIRRYGIDVATLEWYDLFSRRLKSQIKATFGLSDELLNDCNKLSHFVSPVRTAICAGLIPNFATCETVHGKDRVEYRIVGKHWPAAVMGQASVYCRKTQQMDIPPLTGFLAFFKASRFPGVLTLEEASQMNPLVLALFAQELRPFRIVEGDATPDDRFVLVNGWATMKMSANSYILLMMMREYLSVVSKRILHHLPLTTGQWHIVFRIAAMIPGDFRQELDA